jgi:hypothetical protein
MLASLSREKQERKGCLNTVSDFVLVARGSLKSGKFIR